MGFQTHARRSQRSRAATTAHTLRNTLPGGGASPAFPSPCKKTPFFLEDNTVQSVPITQRRRGKYRVLVLSLREANAVSQT